LAVKRKNSSKHAFKALAQEQLLINHVIGHPRNISYTSFFLQAIWTLPELREILTIRMTDRLGHLQLAEEKPTIYKD
jgi:hypothetical protein